MYTVNLYTEKYSNAWDNYTLDYRITEEWDLDEMLRNINAVDNPLSREEIYFKAEEDALAFLLKYS